MDILRTHRDSDGRWYRFPFHYTLLALLEIDDEKATGEMAYAAPRLERLLRRHGTGDQYASRRRAVAERVLARI